MREIAVRSTSTVAVSWAATCRDSTIRLAMVWRSLDIFSVVPRSVLAPAAADAAAGVGLAGACGAGGAAASALAASAAAIDLAEINAVLLGQLADQRGDVPCVGLSGRGCCRGRRRRRRGCGCCRLLGLCLGWRGACCCSLGLCLRLRFLGLWLGFGFGLRRWLGFRLWRWFRLGGCRTWFTHDCQHRSDLDGFVLLHSNLEQHAGHR